MIYLDENWTLKFKMGEVDTTRGLDYHVFYSEVFTAVERQEKLGKVLSQVDSFEVTSGTSATPATTEVSMLVGPQGRAQTAEFNTNTSTARRYKCRVVVCNKDTVARTLYLFLEGTVTTTTERYLTYGISIPAGGVFTWDENGQVLSGSPITSIVAGNGLTGGGSSGAVTLDVQVDGSTLEINADTVRVKDVGITNAKIANATIDLTTKVTGVLPNANGGTNQSTYTTGDLLYASASNTLSKLGIGSSGQVLAVAAGIPAWGSAAASGNSAADSNFLINGGMEIWQRTAGASTAMADDSFAASPDRWNGLIQGANATIVRSSANTLGVKSRYAMRLTAGGTTNRAGICQMIETATVAGSMRSKAMTLTLSAYAFKNSGTGSIDLRYAVVEWTGTADTLTSDIVNDWTSSTYTAGNFFINTAGINVLNVGVTSVAHNVVSDISFSAGTIGANSNNVYVIVWLEDVPAHASDLIDIGQIGLWPTSATPSAWVSRPIQQELALCQRYYEKSYDLDTAPGTATSVGRIINTSGANLTGANQMFMNTQYKVTKRSSTLTLTVRDQSTNSGKVTGITAAGGTADNIAYAGAETHSNGFNVWLANTAYAGMCYQFTADAEL